MRKIVLLMVLLSSPLLAAPKAVVFDYGDVLATSNRGMILEFLCQSLQIAPERFDALNREKRLAVQNGETESDFWMRTARERGVAVSDNWAEQYQTVLKDSCGVDPQMYALVDALKEQKIVVGLLSNITAHYGKMIRGFGFYDPFEPCLLSYEIGVVKPDAEAYLLLIERLQMDPAEVVFIDDKEDNVESAKQLGIDAIQFYSAEQIQKELTKRGLLL